MPTKTQWNKHWIEVALVTSKLSKDPSTKVGAVIVTRDNRQCSIGYNGFARGIKENKMKWTRPIKYERVIHAEMNALLNCPFETINCKIYLTHQPCHRCIGHVLNSGITEIYYANAYANVQYLDIWEEHAQLFKVCKHIRGII
jgi:dCMP deaminase